MSTTLAVVICSRDGKMYPAQRRSGAELDRIVTLTHLARSEGLGPSVFIRNNGRYLCLTPSGEHEMSILNLSADELLTTTRAVRKRLDFDRPVDSEVISDCIRVAQQAPSASNSQIAHFVVVTDPAKKARLADIWRRGRLPYSALPISWQNYQYEDPEHAATIPRMGRSVEHLAANLHRAPAMVIPCVTFRTDGSDVMLQALVWGAVLPSVWSFCLAARERGLGTCWTTIHLAHEEEAAEVLSIPYHEVMQVALLPVAYTKGTDFKPAFRLPVTQIAHWEAW